MHIELGLQRSAMTMKASPDLDFNSAHGIHENLVCILLSEASRQELIWLQLSNNY